MVEGRGTASAVVKRFRVQDLTWAEKEAFCHRWASSGLSKNQFCRNERLALPTFCIWCNKVWPPMASKKESLFLPAMNTEPMQAVENVLMQATETKSLLELKLPNHTIARVELEPLAIASVTS